MDRPIVVLVLIVVALPMLLLPACYNPLADVDEAVYASAAANLLQTGDPWTLQLNGEPWWDKPPVLVWQIALCLWACGESEWVVRLPAVIAGLATLALVWHWGKQVGPVGTGAFAFAILLGAQDFVRFSAKGQMDVPITFLLVAQLYFLAGRRQPLPVGILGGLALATKNQVGLFTILADVAVLFIRQHWRLLLSINMVIAIGTMAIVACPWFIHQYVTHGDRFVDSFLFFNVKLFAEQAQQQASAGGVDYLFYIRYLFTRQLLFALLATFGIGYFLATRWQLKELGQEDPEGDRWFSLAMVVLAVASLCGRTMYWYLVPAYPPLALLAARALASTLPTRHHTWVLLGLVIWALAFNVSYYIPPPKEEWLRAAQAAKLTVQDWAKPQEVVYLLHPPAPTGKGRPAGLQMPTTHFHWRRVVAYAEGAQALQPALARQQTLVLVGSPSVFSEHFAEVFQQQRWRVESKPIDDSVSVWRVTLESTN